MYLSDSFTTNLVPYISQTFNNVEYIWDFNFPKYEDSLIKSEPDIVIIEIVERAIDRLSNEIHFKFKERN